MSKHVFVVMPFGQKEGIDFDAIYDDLLEPALKLAGLIPFRADQEKNAGSIRADMFQELVLADLVVADLSINNANVWYELGIRHGVKPSGILQIRHSEGLLPFDVTTDRTFHYQIDKATGQPPADTLQGQREALAELAKLAIAPGKRAPTSPLYRHFPGLREPTWKALKIEGNSPLWAEFDSWQLQLNAARNAGRAGDILLLAQEAPTRAFQTEALMAAAAALMDLSHLDFALDQIEAVLAIDSDHCAARQLKAVLLGRLGQRPRAQALIEQLLKAQPNDAENLSLQGRLYKEDWLKRWTDADGGLDGRQQKATRAKAILRQAADAYRQAFKADFGHYYSGINAVTLDCLSTHLGIRINEPELSSIMVAGIRWILTATLAVEKPAEPNYWARACLAELETLAGEDHDAIDRWQEALDAGGSFAMDSSRQQLTLLRKLGFRENLLSEIIVQMDERLRDLQPPWTPDKVFLFSGHMIDQPDRKTPRFPESKAAAAAAAIGRQLDELGAGKGDLAVCSAACGGDLLFAEACLAREVPVSLHLADLPANFKAASVSFAGNHWVERFNAVCHHKFSKEHILPTQLGNGPKDSNKYERTNLWMLNTALAWEPDETRLITLWNGEDSGNPGGTSHMQSVVQARGGLTYVIDPKAL